MCRVLLLQAFFRYTVGHLLTLIRAQFSYFGKTRAMSIRYQKPSLHCLILFQESSKHLKSWLVCTQKWRMLYGILQSKRLSGTFSSASYLHYHLLQVRFLLSLTAGWPASQAPTAFQGAADQSRRWHWPCPGGISRLSCWSTSLTTWAASAQSGKQNRYSLLIGGISASLWLRI